MGRLCADRAGRELFAPVDALGDEQGNRNLLHEAAPPYAQCGEPVIQLANFRGMRWDKPVISLPSAEVFPGQFIAVVGPNGAGKARCRSV